MKIPLLAFLLAVAAHAQTAASPAFEAASIKPHAEPITFSGSSASGSIAKWTAATLLDLISGAYDLNYYQIAGIPHWAESSHFDIVARSPGGTAPTKDELHQMVRTLLAERFHLKVHNETRELPVYALTIGKSGPKLDEPDTTKPPGLRTMANGTGIHITSWQTPMKRLAEQLSVTAGRPVLDQTGLTGAYAFKLEFNPMTTESELPSMSTAVQDQLGLRLEPRKAPIEILVIENAEKPSEN